MAEAILRLSTQGAAQVIGDIGSVAVKMRDLEKVVASSNDEVKNAFTALTGSISQARENISSNAIQFKQSENSVKSFKNEIINGNEETVISQQKFLSSLREQSALLGKSTEDVLRYRAAQLGIGEDAAPIILQLQNQRIAQSLAAKSAKDEADAQREAAIAKQRITDQQRSFIAGLQEQTELQGKSQAEVLRYRAAQLGVSQDAEEYIKKLDKVNNVTGKVGISAGQTAFALRQVPAQFTDIVVSLQSGQKPLTVLLQQGGQLKDLFGGIAPAAKAVGGYIAGLINPYTLAALAIGGTALAYNEASKEASEFNKAIITSGNTIGTNKAALIDYAAAISASTGETRKSADAALVGIVETGKVSSANLQKFAGVAVAAEATLGVSAKETVKQFEELGRTPSESLAKIASKYPTVTVEIYKQVKALEDQGRFTEAATLAQNAFADGLSQHRFEVLNSLTSWERGWERIKANISGSVDAAINFFRESSDFEKINQLLKEQAVIEQNIKNIKDGKASAQFGRDLPGNTKEKLIEAGNAALDANKKEINSIREKQDAQKKLSDEKKRANEIRLAGIKFYNDGNKYLTEEQKLKKEIADAVTLGNAANLSAQEIEYRVSQIRRKNLDKSKDDPAKKDLEGRLGGIEANYQKERDVLSFHDQYVAQLRAQDLIDLSTYEEYRDRSLSTGLQSAITNFDAEIKALQDYKSKSKKLTDQQDAQNKIEDLVAKKEKARIDASQQQALNLLDKSKAQSEFNKTLNEFVRVQADSQAQLQFDIDLYGKSALEINKLVSARRIQLEVEERIRQAQLNSSTPIDSSALRQAAEKAKAETDALLDQADRKSKDPLFNATEAIRRYGEEASNVGQQIGDALTNAFKSSEDALVQFATTGKLSFKGLAQSIIADLARIQAKNLISSLTGGSGLSSLFGLFGGSAASAATTSTATFGTAGSLNGLYSGLGFANGGRPPVGLASLVGERGPELFIPSQPGTIIPNEALGGNVQVNVTVNATTGQSTVDTQGQDRGFSQLGKLIGDKVREVIITERRNGGLLA